MFQLLKDDPRFKLEAYQFVREALGFAQEVLNMAGDATAEDETVREKPNKDDPFENPFEVEEQRPERHITGQQLCEAIRRYATDQYGYMAKVVLNSWGIHETGNFGDIVYNLIEIGWMKKSDRDRREDFNDVYDFSDAFCGQFQITLPDQSD